MRVALLCLLCMMDSVHSQGEYTEYIRSLSFSQDAQRIVAGNDEHMLTVWNATTMKKIKSTPRAGGISLFSPDQSQIISAYQKAIRVWDATSLELLREKAAVDPKGIKSISCSPDGTLLVVGGYSALSVWDLASLTRLAEASEGHAGWVRSVAFSPDGQSVVSVSDDKAIRVWDVSSLGIRQAATDVVPLQLRKERVGAHGFWVRALSVSSDGSRLASGSHDTRSNLKVWDAASLELLGEKVGADRYRVNSVQFSPDGAHIASGGDDRAIRLWDSTTLDLVAEREAAHSGAIFALAYSPDGAAIASGSYDKIRLWDAATLAELGAPAADGSARSSSQPAASGSSVTAVWLEKLRQVKERGVSSKALKIYAISAAVAFLAIGMISVLFGRPTAP